MAERIVITGGPHTGKTTLFESLKVAYPDANFVPEPATVVIGRHGTNIIKRPCDFCKACMEYSSDAESAINGSDGLAIFDRSLIDTVAYARRDGCETLLPELFRRIKTAKYTGAILCDFVGEYANSSTRYENVSEAQATHQIIKTSYEEFQLPIMYLPKLPLDERTSRASDFINSFI